MKDKQKLKPLAVIEQLLSRLKKKSKFATICRKNRESPQYAQPPQSQSKKIFSFPIDFSFGPIFKYQPKIMFIL